MVVRIEVTDPKLKEREEAAIADLRALAPDGNTAGIDSKDKALGKRLSKLYKALGYESRGDMIEAFGFTTGGAGGRPRSVDPAVVVDELVALFAGREPAKSIDAIAAEFPEIGSKIRSATRYAEDVFGRGFADELRARGVLRRRGSAGPDGEDVEVIAMIEQFKALYADADEKPKTIQELFAAHPECKHLSASLSRASERLFGMKPKRYLQSVGILQSNASRPSDLEGLEAALDDMGQRIAAMSPSEVPATFPPLLALFPEYEPLLSTARAYGVVTKESLQERGILRKSERRKSADREKLLDRTVRNASVEELSRLWLGLSLPEVVDGASASAELLPLGVASIDVVRAWEVKKDALSYVGDSSVVENVGDTGETLPRKSRFYGKDATVVAVSKHEGRSLVQAEVREARPLRSETLLYGLWKAGVLNDDDFTLSDDWRSRYSRVLEA